MGVHPFFSVAGMGRQIKAAGRGKYKSSITSLRNKWFHQCGVVPSWNLCGWWHGRGRSFLGDWMSEGRRAEVEGWLADRLIHPSTLAKKQNACVFINPVDGRASTKSICPPLKISSFLGPSSLCSDVCQFVPTVPNVWMALFIRSFNFLTPKKKGCSPCLFQRQMTSRSGTHQRNSIGTIHY
jgi:hypothetical protein